MNKIIPKLWCPICMNEYEEKGQHFNLMFSQKHNLSIRPCKKHTPAEIHKSWLNGHNDKED